jgi:hypothetical protein
MLREADESNEALESHPLPAPAAKSEPPQRTSAPGPSVLSATLDARPGEPGSPAQQLGEVQPPPDETRSTNTIHRPREAADIAYAPRASPMLEARAVIPGERAGAVAPTRTTMVPNHRGIEVTPAAARRAAPPSMAQPAPPTVHVTIGRLEVRALTTAAPAIPRAAAPRPQLTLAEYLARRDQASR